jgi:hypothetical protein
MLTRRTLLGRGSRAALGLAALALGCRPGDADSRGRDALASLVSELRGAGALGRAYLERHPDETREDALVSILLDGIPPEDAAIRESLASLLGERNRRDFEAGDVDELDGWIVGRTEARLYALASLSAAH